MNKEAHRAEADRGAANSLEWYARAHGGLSAIEIRTVLSHLKLKRHHRVLEIGCGAGRMTLAIAPRVASVYATDFSQGCIHALGRNAAARGITNVRAEALDAGDLRLGLATAAFDRAFAGQVLTSIEAHEERVEAVRRLRWSLRSGGLFVTVNYRNGGIKDGDHGVEANGRPWKAFTPQGIASLLQEGGFQRVRVRGCVNVPDRLRRVVDAAPWAVAPFDVAFSHRTRSQDVGRYLIATGTA